MKKICRFLFSISALLLVTLTSGCGSYSSGTFSLLKNPVIVSPVLNAVFFQEVPNDKKDEPADEVFVENH